MATDTFAKIGDIKGESQDDKHKEEIELLSWSWGVNQTGTASHGSGAGAGKASFSDFSFAHYVDKASPNLMKACATGEHIKEATITQRKAGKVDLEYKPQEADGSLDAGLHFKYDVKANKEG